METIKTIDVIAKEWFDKVNGNSYFSATVTVNFGLSDQREIKLPFQYGYGNLYEQQAFYALQKERLIPLNTDLPYWRFYQENNIIYRHSKKENCKKRDLKD